MPFNILDMINPIFGTFPRARPIRRIKDGSRIDSSTERDLRGLPEKILRDIGFTSLPG